MLCQNLEVLARIEQLLVALDRIFAHGSLAKLDQVRLQVQLRRREQPLGIELEAQAPELLATPHFRI